MIPEILTENLVYDYNSSKTFSLKEILNLLIKKVNEGGGDSSLTQEILDALNNANTPDESNPFATIADIGESSGIPTTTAGQILQNQGEGLVATSNILTNEGLKILDIGSGIIYCGSDDTGFIKTNERLIIDSDLNTTIDPENRKLYKSNGTTVAFDWENDIIELTNGSKLKQGTDEGRGGSGGIALECAVGYDLQWENGVLYFRNTGGSIGYAISYNPSVPDTSFDSTKQFIVDALFYHTPSNTIYKCTDNTEGAAVWEAQRNSFIPLTGTTEGNPVTGDLEFQSEYIISSNDTAFNISKATTNFSSLTLDENFASYSKYTDSSVVDFIIEDNLGKTITQNLDNGTAAIFQGDGNEAVVRHSSNGGVDQSSLVVNSEMKVFSSYAGFAGLQEDSDYSANYTDLSLVNKGYVDAKVPVPYSGTTDGSGEYTVTFDTPYDNIPNIQASYLGTLGDVNIACEVTTTDFKVTATRPDFVNISGSNVLLTTRLPVNVNVNVLITPVI